MNIARQSELLGLLQEECAETVQVASKIGRFGMESCHPNDLTVNNRQMLEQEIADIQAIIYLLIDEGFISSNNIQAGFVKKMEKLRAYGIVTGDEE